MVSSSCVSLIDLISAISAADMYFSIRRRLTRLCKMLINVSGRLERYQGALDSFHHSPGGQYAHVLRANRISLKTVRDVKAIDGVRVW
jgi:hypothetical protein